MAAALAAGLAIQQALGAAGNGHEARGKGPFAVASCPLPRASRTFGSQALAQPSGAALNSINGSATHSTGRLFVVGLRGLRKHPLRSTSFPHRPNVLGVFEIPNRLQERAKQSA